MTDRQQAQISSRKRPKQARSTELVAAILEAATQVLAKEGAPRFTTARVAERSGSQRRIGLSIFSQQGGDPLPAPERRMARHVRSAAGHRWRTSRGHRSSVCAPSSKPSSARNATKPQCVWRSMTRRLLYRDAPEAREARTSGDRTMQVFMREALPEASESTCALAADLITTTLSKVGKHFSETPRSAAEIETYAGAVADMFCAYLESLAAGSDPHRLRPLS